MTISRAYQSYVGIDSLILIEGHFRTLEWSNLGAGTGF